MAHCTYRCHDASKCSSSVTLWRTARRAVGIHFWGHVMHVLIHIFALYHSCRQFATQQKLIINAICMYRYLPTACISEESCCYPCVKINTTIRRVAEFFPPPQQCYNIPIPLAARTLINPGIESVICDDLHHRRYSWKSKHVGGTHSPCSLFR